MTAVDHRVRPAGVGDADELFRMASLLATSSVPERGPFDRSLTAILADPNQCLLLARSRSRTTGYLYGLVHPAFHANGNIGWVEELYVDQSGRGGGIGSLLMREFERWSVDTAQARYFAVATRRAGDFYRSVGYTESAGYFKKVAAPPGDG